MAARSKRLTDVFLLIDMIGTPEHTWTNPETGETTPCWPFKGKLNSEQRAYVQINGKKYLVYRLVYELTTGEQLGKRMYLHQCDRSWCCNPKHGKAGEHVENMDEMKQRERHGMSHHAVRMVKKLIAKGLSDAEISELTGSGRSTIYDIRNGITFAHVKIEEEQ